MTSSFLLKRERSVSPARWWNLLFIDMDILPLTDAANTDVIWASVSYDGYRLSVAREQGTGGAPVWPSTLQGLFPHCSEIYLKWYFDTNISPNVYVVQEHLEIPSTQYEYDFQSCQLCFQRRICLTCHVIPVRALTGQEDSVLKTISSLKVVTQAPCFRFQWQ